MINISITETLLVYFFIAFKQLSQYIWSASYQMKPKVQQWITIYHFVWASGLCSVYQNATEKKFKIINMDFFWDKVSHYSPVGPRSPYAHYVAQADLT